MVFAILPINVLRKNEILSLNTSFKFLIPELKALNFEDLTQEQAK